MEQNNINSQFNQTEETVDIKDLLYHFVSKWYWFVLSVVLCVTAAVFYILRTPPVYSRSEEVMINMDNRGKSIGNEMGAEFSSLGLFSQSSNVYNEIKAFASKANMTEVVRRLNLDMNFTTPGRFHDNTLYGKTLPVSAEIIDVHDDEAMSFTLSVSAAGNVSMSNFTYKNEKISAPEVKGAFADTLTTPVGKIVINPTTNYIAEDYPVINVRRTPIHSAMSAYSKALSVSLSDKQSQVILLSVNDISIQRAEDVLNTLVAVYNENWVADKNQIAVSTSIFINERLSVIEQELSNVDSDISNFKSSNLLPDVKAASSLYLTQSNELNAQISDINNQLYMTKYIKGYISDGATKNELLPANSGISNANIESQIKEYNDKVLQRNNLVENSSVSNPLVLDLDRSLESMRAAIITSVDNQTLALNNQLTSVQRTERQATARIAANPTQAKYLLSVERQQSVKEALYLFLLQKREENELSQAFTAYNTRIIDPPGGSLLPTAPSKRNILLLAFLMGLCIPGGIIYVTEVLNGRVRGKKDLENISVPFAGEIPMASGKVMSARKISKSVHQEHINHTQMNVLVKHGKRDTINEAFRVLRTNVEFMAKRKDHNKILMTSFNSGSGKSFITMNLATSLALKGKKVLMIDCDLRHASLSDYVGTPKKGISNYLSYQNDSFDDLIIKCESAEGLYMLPCGTIPPNPAELLADDRFKNLLATVEPQYDYIFLDCPPVDVVADTQIVCENADTTLFVIRARLLEKSMLPELESFYKKGRFNNMSVILNGSIISEGKYGYKYGYNYGHYGYSSYANDKEEKKKA